MKHLVRNALVTVLGVGLVGCEWGGGGDDNSWNSGSGLANFSGTYRGNGGYLVSDYSASSGTTTTSDGQTYTTYTGEDGGSTGANRVSLSGKTAHGNVKPGSVTIVFGAVSGSAHDDVEGGMEGSYVQGSTNLAVTGGSFEYDTGVWTLQLQPPGLAINQSITLNYSAAGAVTGGGSSSSGSGASGISIYAFNVQQEGNTIRIVDNNGSTYEGSLGSTRTTGGSDESRLIEGDQVMASFEASGRSKANYQVRLTGTFHGTIQSVAETTDEAGAVKYVGSLGSRTIEGTWIEDGGTTGDINGQAGGAAEVSATGTTTE